MDTGIEPFKPSRNDLFVLVLCFILIIFKIIYMIRVFIITNGIEVDYNKNPLDHFPFINPNENKKDFSNKENNYNFYKNKISVQCSLGKDNCVLENIITILSVFFDFVIIFIVTHFVCCNNSALSIRKVKNVSASLIVKLIDFLN